MLKDKLEEMLAKPRYGGDKACLMKAFIETLDPETADSFKKVLASKIGAQTLFNVMRDEGYTVSRPTIEQTRGCFRGEKECQCGVADGSKK